MGRTRSWLGICIVVSTLTPTFAGELPPGFTLGRYIPSDVWLYTHVIANPERDFIAEHWSRVFGTLKDVRLDEDIQRFFSAQLAPEDRLAFDKKWEQMREAIYAVPWTELGGREFVYAQRFIPMLPRHIFLFRPQPSLVESISDSLSRVLEMVASLSPRLSLKKATYFDASVWTLSIQETELGVQLFRRGDVIGFITSKWDAPDILARMAGKNDRFSIVQSNEFREALSNTEAPEDGLTFIRVSLFQKQLRTFLTEALAKAKGDQDVEMFKKVVFKALAHTDIIDHVFTTRRTDGLRERCSGVTVLRRESAEMPLAKAVSSQQTFDPFDRFVPREATSFCVSTFINPGLAYATVLDFIRREIPKEGPEWLKEWERIQNDQLGVHLDRDIFSWCSGEYMLVGLPTVSQSELNGVVFLRTSDPEKAAEKVKTLLRWLTDRFQMIVAPAPDVDAEGFHSAFHPMFAMMQARPVIGVFDEWLVIGSSPRAVNKCLAAGRGLRATISRNAQFKRDGLTPAGAVVGASFSDQSRVGESLAASCMTASVVAGMLPATVDEIRPMRLLLGTFSRMGPVLSKIDFIRSKASVTTREGNRFMMQQLVTYAGPGTPSTPSTPSTPPEPQPPTITRKKP